MLYILKAIEIFFILLLLGWEPSISVNKILSKYCEFYRGKKRKIKEKILICGILPPPTFGHSKMYEMLMRSCFVDEFDITFLNMKFWSYGKHGRVTIGKLLKLIVYYFQFLALLIGKRPKYILYNISFDKMPLLKDALFCFTGKLFGCRIVIHDMGQYLKVLYDDCNSFYRWIIRRLCGISTASIVLGEVTRKVYEGFMERERTFSVHGSVEDSRDLVAKDLSGKQEGKIRILYFSFLSVSKGLMTALKAIPQVIKQNANVLFSFGGPIESESLKEEMDQFIKRECLEDFVEYLGYIDDSIERTKLFRASDIFIFPTHRDVFGLVLLHAMAEGLPVAASIEGAVPEIIIDGENGFLFEKGNADALAQKILLLAGDADLRERISEKNRERYLTVYTPQKYGERMIEAFEKIMQLN